MVSPANKDWVVKLTNSYQEICGELNIKLAEDCPNKDKAFKLSTTGKVLGIEFNTENLSWRVPEDKRAEYMNLITDIIIVDRLSGFTIDRLLGKLNFVCSMAPYMRTFKVNLQKLQKSLSSSASEITELSWEARQDLKTWWAFLLDNESWTPLAQKHYYPSLCYSTFTSDAAGWDKDIVTDQEAGLGCIGTNEEGEIIYCSQILWDMKRVKNQVDHGGSSLGHKTTTLEFAGLLIPVLTNPELFKNRQVVLQVDNIGAVFAWENGYCKDMTASILVRILGLLSAALSTVIYVRHLPRRSTWEAEVADNLSRAESTINRERVLLDRFERGKIPRSFGAWMLDPKEDWSLPERIVNGNIG